jgi:hypothetical protein
MTEITGHDQAMEAINASWIRFDNAKERLMNEPTEANKLSWEIAKADYARAWELYRNEYLMERERRGKGPITGYTIINEITDRPGRLPKSTWVVREARADDVEGCVEGEQSDIYTNLFDTLDEADGFYLDNREPGDFLHWMD